METMCFQCQSSQLPNRSNGGLLKHDHDDDDDDNNDDDLSIEILVHWLEESCTA